MDRNLQSLTLFIRPIGSFFAIQGGLLQKTAMILCGYEFLKQGAANLWFARLFSSVPLAQLKLTQCQMKKVRPFQDQTLFPS
jgi:hypothetical protein